MQSSEAAIRNRIEQTYFHMRTDIDDFHQYISIPDNADRWDKWVTDFASRPEWSFSKQGDAVRTRSEPLVALGVDAGGTAQIRSRPIS